MTKNIILQFNDLMTSMGNRRKKAETIFRIIHRGYQTFATKEEL